MKVAFEYERKVKPSVHWRQGEPLHPSGYPWRLFMLEWLLFGDERR